ncbi:MAG TPA: hypothetical protein VLE89_01525 [Chlamydiales bacterium]|nr:hypothetical protein [Chlamydiales bacterium]
MKIIAFVCLAGSAFAALPPLSQGVRELQAVLADPHLQDELGSSERIQEIFRTENGYVVVTQNYQMRVDVQYQEMRRPGPIPFDLQFYPPVHLKSGESR